MLAKCFDDFVVEEVFETPARTITEADIVNFAGVSGDFTPLHMDEEFAKQGPFGRRVAHGLLTLAVTIGLWMKMGIFEGTIAAFYGMDRLRFTKPVYIGDTIRARVRITEKVDKGQYGLMTLENEVTNQRNETVLVFQAKLLMKKKSQA
ncbi:MAG: bifunctional aldehyde dehydrogenase/enoyl-CoA hydratase [Candidatus Bathyarchaeota archaeon BA1]|nr:MAG: bifunctional aldehyde dehydrogenase/enoyl-CoA hydratase [Candidatus Bathyarchaeota archaeon BA1]